MTDFLYKRPSFIDGFASIINIRGQLPLYNTSTSSNEADRRALYADILSIRSDMKKAISSFPFLCEKI